MKRGAVLLLVLLSIPIALAVSLPENLPAETHPFTLYTAGEVSTIQTRVTREPYLSWWNSIQASADSYKVTSHGSFANEKHRAVAAKYLAFAYVITGDASYGNKARELLLKMNDNVYQSQLNNYEGLTYYCQAYDMLKGAGYNFGGYEDEVRESIQEDMTIMASDFLFSQEYPAEFATIMDDPKNNHKIKRYSAIGMAAMTIADEPSKTYIVDGWDIWMLYENDPDNLWKADGFLAHQRVWYTTSSDQIIDSFEGGFAEGANYMQYAANNFIPFMVAKANMGMDDWLEEPIIKASLDWLTKVRLPNGKRPNFDDAAMTYYYLGLWLGEHSEAETFVWDWQNSADYVPWDFRPDAIALYDDSVVPQVPTENPTLFLPEVGNAVFRSSWTDSDAVYMMLLGENGKARTNGLAHEHPDANSFSIFAFGEPLAIDSGYINWDNHWKVNDGTNHNLIMVDGSGPEMLEIFGIETGAEADAYLEDYFATDDFDYSESRTYYDGTSFRRHVLFPNQEYFIVVDDVDGSASHNYDFLLHGNGGGTSGGSFASSSNGGTWTKGNAKLLMFTADPDSISTYNDIHSFDFGVELTHTVVSARKTATDTQFLTVLYPESTSNSFPSITDLSQPGYLGLKIGSGTDVTFSQETNVQQTYPTSLTGLPKNISSDALIVYSSFNGNLDSFFIEQGTNYWLNELELVSASNVVSLSLTDTGSTWEGYVSGEGSYSVTLYTETDPGTVLFNGASRVYSFEGGFTTINLNGEGTLEIPLATNPVCSDEDGDDYGHEDYFYGTDYCTNSGSDCDDDNSSINPGATELCDSVDNNCDGTIDEDCGCIVDETRDCGLSFGECEKGTQTCDISGQWGDCIGAVWPTAEICDELDNDCNTLWDDVAPGTPGSARYYIDLDTDGYGDPEEFVWLCDISSYRGGYYNIREDEVYFINDCDDVTIDDCGFDQSSIDCSNPANSHCAKCINVGADEVCDGVDNDCDGNADEDGASGCTTYYNDKDNDGYGVTGDSRCLCSTEGDYTATNSGDCNDYNYDVYPGAYDDLNSIDENCDGEVDELFACDTWSSAIGLVSYWRFDEESGNIINDTIGNNDGLALSASRVVGVVNTALSFDGFSYVNVNDPTDGSLDFDNSFSIEAWIKNNDSSDNQVIVEKGSSGAYYRLYLSNVGEVVFEASDGSTTSTLESSTGINDGEWHHITAYKTHYFNQMFIFIDGVQAGVTSSPTGSVANSNNFRIGSDFVGEIDEVAMYNKPLTSADNYPEKHTTAGKFHDTGYCFDVQYQQGGDGNGGEEIIPEFSTTGLFIAIIIGCVTIFAVYKEYKKLSKEK